MEISLSVFELDRLKIKQFVILVNVLSISFHYISVMIDVGSVLNPDYFFGGNFQHRGEFSKNFSQQLEELFKKIGIGNFQADHFSLNLLW